MISRSTLSLTGGNSDIISRKTSSWKQSYDAGYFLSRCAEAVRQIINKSSNEIVKENKYFKVEFTERNFALKSMNENYTYESVSYFTKTGLEDIQVYPINGTIYNNDFNLYNSSTKLNENTGDGEMIVMDTLGNMFIAPKDRGILHHSSFFSGGPVAFAGLCDIENGKIKKLVVYSGHYSPTEKEKYAFLLQLYNIKLIKSQAASILKIDNMGTVIHTINISRYKKIVDLYEQAAKIININKINNLSMFINDATASSSHNAELMIFEANLKSGDQISVGVKYSSLGVVMCPPIKVELVITDSPECAACHSSDFPSTKLVYTSCCFQKVCEACDKTLKECVHCKAELGELRIRCGWSSLNIKNLSNLRLLKGSHTAKSVIEGIQRLFPAIAETQLTNPLTMKKLDSNETYASNDAELTAKEQYFVGPLRLPHLPLFDNDVKGWIVALLYSGKCLTKEELHKKCNIFAARISPSLSQEYINSIIEGLEKDGYCKLDNKTSAYSYTS